jgi:copper chaperone CopZ
MRFLALIIITFAVGACQLETAPSGEKAKDVKAEVAKVDTTPTAHAPAAKAKTTAKAKSGCCGGACAGSCGGGCGGPQVAVEQPSADELPADTVWSTMAVQGMMCGSCERRIIAAVSAIDGVSRVEASAGKGEVRLALNGVAKDSLVSQARKRINELGFTAQ